MDTAIKAMLDTAEKNFTTVNSEVEQVKTEIKSLRDAVENIEIPTAPVPMVDRKAANDAIFKKAIAQTLKTARDKGESTVSALAELKALDLQPSDPSNGSLAVDEVLASTIIERAREAYPMIGEVGSKPMSRNYREMVLTSFPTVEAGSEAVAPYSTGAENLTDTQQYVEVRGNTVKSRAKALATDEVIAGADVDVWAHFQNLVQEEVGRYLNNQILFGDGSAGQMRGILSSRIDKANAYAEALKETFGADQRDPDVFPVVPTGIDGSIGGDSDAIVDYILSLMEVLPTVAHQNAKFYMNRRTMYFLMSVKDSDGRPLFMPSYMTGQFSLFGYPIVIEDTMPDFDVKNGEFIIFGDLTKAFFVSQGDVVKYLIDPYSVDSCVLAKLDQEYHECVGSNNQIVVGIAATSIPTA